MSPRVFYGATANVTYTMNTDEWLLREEPYKLTVVQGFLGQKRQLQEEELDSFALQMQDAIPGFAWETWEALELEQKVLIVRDIALHRMATERGISLPPGYDSLPPSGKLQIIDHVRYDWKLWAREQQVFDETNAFIILALCGRGWGKGVLYCTPIPTPLGWRKIGELKVGDLIFDEAGRPCTVKSVYDYVPERAYRFDFSDGTSLDVCDEHQWVTWTHAERKAFLRSKYVEDRSRFPEDWVNWRSEGSTWAGLGPQIRTSEDIVSTFTTGKRGDTNHCVPTCGPLRYAKQDLPIDPYVLGAWLGDGSANDGTVASGRHDSEWMTEQFAAYGGQYREKSTTIRTYGLYTQLRALGVKNNKHVPRIYLESSVEDRLALLQGLMDTDGTCDQSGSKVEFCNTNKELADAVVELARSLGQKPVIAQGEAKLYGRVTGPKWRVQWRPTIQVFRMPRKAEMLKFDGAQALRNHHRMIVRYKEIDPAPMRCLTVDSPNSMYLIGEGMIPTHNTRAGAEHIVDRASKIRGSTWLIASPILKYVKETLIEGDSGILTVAGYNDGKRDKVVKYNRNDLTIMFANGSRIVSAAGDKERSFRGPNLHGAWLDEFSSVRNAQEALDALIPAVRNGKNPHLLITTTPKPTESIKKLYAQAKTAKTHTDGRLSVQWISGSTFDNAANLPEATLEELKNRYEGSRVGRQELSGELLLDVEGALLKRSMVQMTQTVPPLRRISIGVDPAVTVKETSDKTGICIIGCTHDSTGVVLWSEAFRWTPIEWATRVNNLYLTFKEFYQIPMDIVAETNQGGDLVVGNLSTINPLLPVQRKFAGGSKLQRFEPISVLVEQGRIKFYDGPNPWGLKSDILTPTDDVRHEALLDEMTTFTGDRKDFSGSPDSLDAFVHAARSALGMSVSGSSSGIAWAKDTIGRIDVRQVGVKKWDDATPGRGLWVGPKVGL